jgi:hypothetical protein
MERDISKKGFNIERSHKKRIRIFNFSYLTYEGIRIINGEFIFCERGQNRYKKFRDFVRGSVISSENRSEGELRREIRFVNFRKAIQDTRT